MKKKENVKKNDKSVKCNSIKKFNCWVKNWNWFLLSQKENINFDDDFVHIKNVDFKGEW